MSIPRDSVDAGACADFGPCALSSDHCVTVESTGFMSARTVVNSHSGGCKSTSRTTKSKIGRCGEDGPCASVKELCVDPKFFQQPSVECAVMQDAIKGEKMKYGSCISSEFSADKNTCFWSDDLCDDVLSFDFDDNCTCDRVRVGACRKKNDFSDIHCAVSGAACDDLQEFLTVVELKALQVKDCYLCREAPATMPPETKPSTPGPTSAPRVPSPTSAPVPPPTSAPISNPLSTGVSSNNNTGDNNKVLAEAGEIPFATIKDRSSGNKNIGAIVGGTIGALVVAGLLLVFVSRKLRQSKPMSVATPDGDII